MACGYVGVRLESWNCVSGRPDACEDEAERRSRVVSIKGCMLRSTAKDMRRGKRAMMVMKKKAERGSIGSWLCTRMQSAKAHKHSQPKSVALLDARGFTSVKIEQQVRVRRLFFLFHTLYAEDPSSNRES